MGAARTRRKAGPAQSLRLAIDCLPRETRVAMLDGIRSTRIIAGGYSDGAGGVCPMLAAHRRGGRTSFASFARAWDRYTGARRARSASQRELRTLETMLEASLGGATEGFAEAIESVKRARTRPRSAGDANPAVPDGWAWLRPFRRYDHYAATLERLRDLEAERERDAAPA